MIHNKTYEQIALEAANLLKWNADDYSQFIYDCGITYLTYYIKGESHEIFSELIKSRIYWSWWKMNWYARDLVFVDSMITDIGKDNCLLIYKELHDPKTLAAEIYPNGQVLGETYNVMIAQIHKQQHHYAH